MADRPRRERLVTFLLLPTVVVSVLVLNGVMFRSSFKLEQLREQSVVEATLLLANEKADRLDKRIIEQDNAVTSLVDSTELEGFGEEWLEVASIQTPTVRTVLAVDLTAPQKEVVALASRAPGIEDEKFRRTLVHHMLKDMKLEHPGREKLRHLHGTYGSNNYLVSHWERQHEGRRYLMVVWHDVPRIVHDLFPTLYSDTDKQSRVNVVDGDGRIVYGPPLSKGGLTLGRQFETTLYKWRLNVAMTSAEELAAAVARRRLFEMVLVGLSGAVVIAGLIVIMFAVARERKLSNLKSDFVANVSHELKTPLSLVRMFGELLQSGRVESEEKHKQYLQIIVSESERLGALIENVLDFAKVERGKAAYEFVDGNVADVVARAVEACRLRAERQGVALEFAVAPALPSLKLDERAIEIAIINLVDNSLKYARGSERISIDVQWVDRFIEISVTDQGPGIPSEDRKRVFERFERGKAAGGQVRGSGIGLALVKHIAEAHGGKASVDGASPKGCRFSITLRTEAKAPEPASDAHQKEAPA